MFVFTIGRIPRGRAESPESVRPKQFDPTSLILHAEKTKQTLPLLQSVGEGEYFLHPYFGNLKKNDAIRFLEIHTRHHLLIMKDIINNKKTG
jgi:hypothetical protein